jgi:hypothetical protein
MACLLGSGEFFFFWNYFGQAHARHSGDFPQVQGQVTIEHSNFGHEYVQTSASRIDAFYPPVGSTYGESHYFPQVNNGVNTQDKLFQATEVDSTTQITNALSTPQSMVGYASESLPSLGDYNATTLGDNVCTICLGTSVYKSYKNKGDLSRHMKEHSTTTAGRFLCTETLCNRSVDGNGFTRKDKLQSHLEAKHKMSRAQASYRVGQVAVRVRRAGEHSA